MTAIELATLIDAYCMVYTQNPHSRMTGGMQVVPIVQQIMLTTPYQIFQFGL
jgi:hypothetical protein